jgi:DNA-binding MurR/RpiR family transcriptional regulator
MPAPPEVINLPHVLEEMLVKGRTDYERAVRAIRWGQPPVWAVAPAESGPAAETLRYTFEDLLSWPLIVSDVSSFVDGGAGMLHPGSVVVAFTDGAPPAGDAVRAARKRGAQVLVVAGRSRSPTAEPSPVPPAADSQPTVRLPSAGAAAEGALGAACLQHAAAAQLALICARQLTRPQPRLERCEREWRELSSAMQGLVGRLSDGVGALASALGSASPILLVGGGHYGAIVKRAASLARRRVGRTVVGLDLAAFESGWLEVLNAKAAVLLLVCGSSGRIARETAALAQPIKDRGCPVFVITGSNHHDLIRQARLSLILPDTGDLTGSILALAVAGWVGSQLGELTPLGADRPQGEG